MLATFLDHVSDAGTWPPDTEPALLVLAVVLALILLFLKYGGGQASF